MLHRLALLALAAGLAGCGLLRPDPPATPRDALLVLINRAEEPVASVRLAPCHGGEPGAERLDDDELVMPGRTRTFTLEPGCWDLRAVLQDERTVEERGVELTPFSRRTWTLFPAGE